MRKTISKRSEAVRKSEFSAGGVVVDPSGRYVLLVRSTTGSKGWGLPKGHIETNETSLQAATREIEEEAGLPAENLLMICELSAVNQVINFRKSGEFINRNTKFYLFRSINASLATIRKDRAHDAVKWERWNNISKLRLRYKYVQAKIAEGSRAFSLRSIL